ncbi:MAG: hypothetical protein IOD12_08365, partial [Silvanigrellales bacterium]|nr:hypothetical protein [Silvanigrellales bacterium]
MTKTPTANSASTPWDKTLQARSFKALTLSLLALGTAAMATGCGPSEGTSQRLSTSSLDTVEIPQSPVEDQLKIGFCWAYTTVAFVESLHKTKTGETVNVSEEALGFYRIAEELLMMAREVSAADMPEAFENVQLEGWVIRTSENIPDALNLIKTYGLVPESVWTHKFNDRRTTESQLEVIKNRFLKLVKDRGTAGVDVPTLVKEVLVGAGAFPSAPPSNFLWKGKEVSAQQFASSHLGFKSDDFGVVEATNGGDYARVVAATKRALARGLSVPLGMPVNMDRLKKGRFSGAGVDLGDEDAFFREGGHTVLVTDFVNTGGEIGAVDAASLDTELARSPDDLDFLLAKNSWGLGATSNETDVRLSGSLNGYYTLDQLYLRGAAQTAGEPGLKGILSVVVPVDIAISPFSKDAPKNTPYSAPLVAV